METNRYSATLELEKGMDELISILLKLGSNDLDYHVARFFASAGLIVAYSDESVEKEEIANAIAESIPQSYVPSLDAIC